jgi:hypothetical protein
MNKKNRFIVRKDVNNSVCTGHGTVPDAAMIPVPILKIIFIGIIGRQSYTEISGWGLM